MSYSQALASLPCILCCSWWDLVEKSWGVLRKYPGVLPFYTNFDQGRGYHFSMDGDLVSDATWCNISCQGFRHAPNIPSFLLLARTCTPHLNFADSTNPIQVFTGLKGSSYSGGGNITFKGSLEEHAHFEKKIFEAEFLLSELPIHLTYSVSYNFFIIISENTTHQSNILGSKNAIILSLK
ncbi:hypothetical protein AHAS_Ahas10G0113900 [Arachis hypogaea]